jgi:hypothetical protein
MEAAKDDLLVASSFTGASGSVIGAAGLLMRNSNARLGLQFRLSIGRCLLHVWHH